MPQTSIQTSSKSSPNLPIQSAIPQTPMFNIHWLIHRAPKHSIFLSLCFFWDSSIFILTDLYLAHQDLF